MKNKLTMKTWVMLFALLISAGIKAQNITNYSFTATSSIFTPIVGGTPVSTTVSAADFLADDKLSISIPLGFDFVYMGQIYNSVKASTNGFLSFNENANMAPTNNLSASDIGNRPLLAPLWDDLDGASGSGAANYITEGIAGSRIFTIEWLNWQWNYDATGTTISFQVKLYEATGVVEFRYRDDGGAVNNGFASIGITAIPTSSGNFLSLDGTGATPNISSTNANDSLTAKPATGQIYIFEPPVAAPADPTNLTFSGVTGTSMTLNWNDNATNEVEYLIYQSTDSVNYTHIASPPADATTYNASGLSFGKKYYWRVYAINEGKISSALEGSQATNPGTISGNKTIGPAGDYASLTAAFADIDTNGIASSVNLILQSDYVSTVETFPIVPSNSVITTPTSTITIYPAASGLSIEGDNATAIFNFDNAYYITIDGRVNATGAASDLVIGNTNTSGATVQFINGATYNTLKYVKIKGVSTNSNAGVVFFSTTNTSFGNNNNLIDFCDITKGASNPANIIASVGNTTASLVNKNNTISNSNLSDFGGNVASRIYTGIYLDNGTTDWTISDNSIFQTATLTFTNTNIDVRGISISNTSGGNFLITNNYIGGSAPLCGGTPWTQTGSTNIFIGIRLSTSGSMLVSVTGNTIANISQTTAHTGTTSSGISAPSGRFLISGNTIGSATSAGSITLNRTAGAASRFNGILFGAGTITEIDVENNTIDGISMTSATGGYLHGISYSGSGTPIYNVTNNIIGGPSAGITANSNGNLVGIFASSVTPNDSIEGNTIQNLTLSTTNTSAQLIGIQHTNTGVSVTKIKNNIVKNLTSNAPNTNTGSGPSVVGIFNGANDAGGNQIIGNQIFNLKNNNASASVCVTGILYSGPTPGTNVISKNLIYNLEVESSSATSLINGIYHGNGTTYVQNNMVALGHNVSNGIEIRGIYQFLGTDIKFYHNSVYVGGTATSGSANSYAFYRSQSYAYCDIFNNILVNERIGSTGKDHALRINSFSDTNYLLSNNNIFKTSNPANLNTIGAISLTLAGWQSLNSNPEPTNQFDLNSFEANPQFLAPTAATPDLHINPAVPTYAEGKGVLLASVTDDFDGDTRSSLTPNDIGADAGNFISIVTYDIAAIGMVAPIDNICPANNQTITITIKNLSSETIDFATNNVTVGANISGASSQNFTTVVNTGTLAVNDTLNIDVSTSCDLTAAGTHNFSCYALITGDVNTANDTLENNTIEVLPLPVAVTSVSANYDTVCVGFIDPIVLTATGGSGDVLEWYTSSCGGTYIGSGNNFEIAAPVVNTKYFALWTNVCGNSDCDSLTITVLEIPTATATPVGPTILPVNSDNTDYSTSGATNATAYEWLISPIGAGSITGTDTTGTVDWNDTYEGQAEISVVAWNLNCPGDTSDVLTVTLTAPVITTLAASNVTSTAATLNGSINPNGLIIRDISFQYGLDTNYTNSISATVDTAAGTSLIYFSADVTGLASNTAYHFRIYGEANTIVFTGADETFTTNAYVPQFDVTFNITDGINPINGAVVGLAGYGTQTTNSSGAAVFNNVDSNVVAGYDYTVIATSYDTVTGNIGVGSDTVVDVLMPLTPLTYTVTFNVTDGANPINAATVNLTGYTSQTTNSSGVATFTNVAAAPTPGIAWEVIKTGYNTENGNVIVDGNETVNVTMNLTTYTVTFNVTDGVNPINAATVTLTGYGTQTTNSSGVATFTNVVPAASIAWTVEKTGYTTQTGNANITGNQTVNVIMPAATYTVTFNISDGANPVNAANVTLTGYGTQTTNVSGVATFTNVAATATPGIAYSVTKTGFNTNNGNVIVDGNETVNITLNHSYYDVIFHVFDNVSNTPWNTIPVEVLGESTVNTNSNGIAAFSLIMGNYDYEVRFATDTIEGNITVPVSDTIDIPYHVSINELGNVSFGIYPNPANEIINITAAEVIETVKIMDITGTVIATAIVNSNNANIDIAHIAEGNYIVVIETKKGKGMRKLQVIKQ